MAARPLETPRSLPAALQPMASAITGRARPPLFTTGPATRQALAAAGALGATTGTVVHLPTEPGLSVSAVLAHELTHTRSPVRRPRFFLGGASSLLDDDERSALAAGRGAVQSVSGLAGHGQRAADGLTGQAGSTAAGIVDSLPVGGLGAVGEVATRAARAAVLEAAASPVSAVSGLAGQTSGFADRAGGLASGVLERPSGMASGMGSGLTEGLAPGLASGVADTASGYADRAIEAVGGLAAQASSTVAGAARGALDPDKIVEIVEQRLLREIERRGGRWAGVF